MNEWSEEELNIIETYRKQGYTYYQIQEFLKEVGYKRTYESIKKAASNKLGRKDNPRDFGLPEGMETKSVGAKSYSVRTEGFRPLQDTVVEPVNQPVNESQFPVIHLPDFHFPYHVAGTFDFLSDVCKKWKPVRVKCAGDIFDHHRISKHTPEPRSMSITQEIEKATENVYTLSKISQIFKSIDICYGNHDVRPIRMAKMVGIPDIMLLSLKTLYQCPEGWRFKKEFIENGVLYTHAGLSGFAGAINYAIVRRMSVAVGHNHSHGGVLYSNNGETTIFGVNSGTFMDPKSPAADYAEDSKHKSTLGCSVIVSPTEAYFIPMP